MTEESMLISVSLSLELNGKEKVFVKTTEIF
jgi:hypothetical protein